MQLSRQFGWFHDPDRLIVVGCPSESQRDLDFGLGFGLAHAGDRQLILVLPAGSEEPTRRRLPWLDSSVALYTYGPDRTPVPVSPLSRHEVRASLVDKVVSTTHQLGDRATWVARLTQWAEDCPELVPAHRQSYLAWHCRGRMIVKIRRARGRLVVTAGVHHSSQDLAPEPVAITSTLEPEAFHRLVATASAAIADRLEGVDTDNAEHQLQERLASAPSKLGLLRTLREFPAIRPGGGRGYIDLLGVDKDGGIHVVETKIGPDTMLALQGLDYWVWTTSHLDEIVTHLTDDLRLVVNPKAPVKLDFVVADKAGAFVSPYTAAQLEAIDGSIPWEVHQLTDWDSDDFTVTSLGRRRTPPGPRASEPAYANRLQDRLIANAGDTLDRRVFFTPPGAGIIGDAQPALAELRTRGVLHGFVDHVRSSQAFAVNLFGGVGDDCQRAIWDLLGAGAIEPESLEFEYTDPQDALAEMQPKRPHQTQVDVALWGTRDDGSRHVALIEVKLTETGFGACSAFESPHNDRRDVCRSAGPWGGDPTACFQLRNHGGPHRRRYDQHLDPALVTPTTAACEFLDLNQPMRNVALARALIDRGEAVTATFALCAPGGNTNVWRQWRRARDAFTGVPGVTIADLPAETLVTVLPSGRRDALASRYDLLADQ